MLNPNRKLFRWGPIDACPLFMHYTIPSSFEKMYDIFGYCYSESIIIFENKKVLWILDNQDFMNNGIEFTKEHIINPDNKKLWMEKWNSVVKLLLGEFKKLEQVDIEKVDNQELYKLFDEFTEIYFKFWEIGMTVELVILALELWLGEKLKNKIEDVRKYNEVFAKLTTEIDLTFYREEEKELLEISKLNEEEQETALKEHQKKYYWIYNSYLEAKVLGLAYFKHELEKMKKGKDIEKILNEMSTYTEKVIGEKKDFIEKLGLGESYKTLIKNLEDFCIIQDKRKAYNFIANHHLELFAQEIAKRFNLDLYDVKVLLPKEVKQLIENKLNKNIIKERKPLFILHFIMDKMEIITGDEAEKIKSKYAVIKKTDQSRVIQGVLASRGESYYFRGVAKILSSPKEVDKINEGDILITKMTSPDYIVAMRKAGAIITDEGGILCHAAVVSRELGITCIVGTKVATKMIKDGDVIEIHGGRGTVKIIERKG